MVEPSARFEDIKIRLPDPIHGLEEVSGVLGIPRWWPTGSRVGVVICHGANDDMDNPVLEHIHRELTERRFLSLFRDRYRRVSLRKRALMHSGQGDSNRQVIELLVLCRAPREAAGCAI